MKSARAEFDKPTREAAWKRCQGRCERCRQPFDGRTPHYDHHPVPAALGGPATLENCRVLCTSCHKWVTKTRDMPMISKAKRIEEKRAGLRPRRSTFLASRDGPYRKKINGEVERR